MTGQFAEPAAIREEAVKLSGKVVRVARFSGAITASSSFCMVVGAFPREYHNP
jgi:hypothetical protein